MSTQRFLPRVEEIETRLTPSTMNISPQDVFNAAAQVQLDTAVLRYITNEALITNPVTLPYVENFLRYVNSTGTSAVAVLNQFVSDLAVADPTGVYASTSSTIAGLASQGQADVAYAQAFAGMLNVSLSPPVISPPPPPTTGSGGGTTIDLTSDSGMASTIPSITGFTDLGDGVKFKDVLVGQGNAATSTSNVTIYYTGWLAANGTIFDSRRSPGTNLGNFANGPATFGLAGTIDGFQEGVAGMKPGGIRDIFIPASKGYGATGQGSVPPNADLVFEVKLISTT